MTAERKKTVQLEIYSTISFLGTIVNLLNSE